MEAVFTVESGAVIVREDLRGMRRSNMKVERKFVNSATVGNVAQLKFKLVLSNIAAACYMNCLNSNHYNKQNVGIPFLSYR